MPLIARRKFHRGVFLIAGIYNISWGLYSVYDPQWLFRFSGLPLLNHPQIFACLAMVVGLYGIIYLEVARVPERGWLLAAVGLVGKVLGPIGLAKLIWDGTWPSSTIVLCLSNDFIWWIPFLLYLLDAWPFLLQTFEFHEIADHNRSERLSSEQQLKELRSNRVVSRCAPVLY